jgi:hypothetical protein
MYVAGFPQPRDLCGRELWPWMSLCLLHAVLLPLPCPELGKVEVTVFDPNSLDPNRCESCYGAESEDIK